MSDWLNEKIILNKNSSDILIKKIIDSMDFSDEESYKVTYRELFDMVLVILNELKPSLEDKEAKSFNCVLNMYKMNNNNKFPY